MPMLVRCVNCHQPYPPAGVPYRCPSCGGLYDSSSWPAFDITQIQDSISGFAPGIWRYQSALGLPPGSPQISLGEGNTPLAKIDFQGRQVNFKLEYLNPSGSFKDRGSASLVSFLCNRGVRQAIEDSSGNAGASFAAYAARAGIQARVYVPETASGPKRRQIEAYGAQVIPVPGPRSNATQAVLQAVSAGAIYASHAYLPFNLPGYATLAYELYFQLGQKAPGTLIIPVGQGGLLLGVARGFDALHQAGLIQHLPRLIGVQAQACAPLWAMAQGKDEAPQPATEAATLAEGVGVLHPVRSQAVLEAVAASNGMFFRVAEDRILPARDALARLGFYVEPTSALVWNVLEQGISTFPPPVVAVLTGSGLKYE